VRIVIAAVGRLKRGPEQQIIDSYLKRLRWPVTIRETAETGPQDPHARRQRETALLLNAVPDGAVAIALDRRGEALTSEAFTARLRQWRDAGQRDFAFLIGGAEGLDESVLPRMNLVLAFGDMTWPHALARCMLVEQLYRAQQILAGHPYHRE
jgi:23S rRNA (pseudouridine1915-N3)-methyltransferase